MTFNTGNPIGSTDARDLSDNAENFDTALGTTAATWVDRFGVTRDSFEGRLAKGSFYRVGDFTTGYTLTNMRQTLEYNGHEYSWAGTFPKVIAAGATPATSGGIGAGAWVDRTDLTLRGELSDELGSDLIGYRRNAAAALATTVSDVLQSLKYNLAEFTVGASSVSAAITNMLDNANGAGCYIPAGVYNLESAVSHTGTVRLVLDDEAVVNFQGVWLTVTNGDYSVVAGGRLTTPVSAYMVNRWDGNYDLLPSGSYVYGSNLSQGYQVSGNDPEYSDWLANHPAWVTFAETGVSLVGCKHATVTKVTAKFGKVKFIDCEFSSAYRNTIHGGKDVYGAISFVGNTKTSQHGNSAKDNIVFNSTHNGICWDSQVGFVCSGNLSVMNGESGIKRMQNTHPSVGCVIDNNTCISNFYDGIDTLTNFPPTGSVSSIPYKVRNNTSSGNGLTSYSAEGAVEFSGNTGDSCGAFGLWGKYINNSDVKNNVFVNCNRKSDSGYAALLCQGHNNSISDNRFMDSSPVNAALYIDGNNNTYTDNRFDPLYTAPLYTSGTGNIGVGNRGVKSSGGNDLEDYLYNWVDNFKADATQAGIGFRIRNSTSVTAARILANLDQANPTYTSMSFFIRNYGADKDGVQIQSPVSQGQTYLNLRVTDPSTGAESVKRVKIGASGSGPSGGRVLYTDA